MVKLFKMKDPKDIPGSRPSSEKPELLKEKADMFQESILALFTYLKAFALDIQELQTEHYHRTIDALSEKFQNATKPKRVAVHFDGQKEKIRQFIDAQHQYIGDRDNELRDIIDLLTKAMASLTAENQEFYKRVYDQGEKILELSLLDDIKKIRQSLQEEVEQMRTLVASKKDLEQRQIQLLSGQVTELQQELEHVKVKSMTDGLTSAFNRQALDEHLAAQIESHKTKRSGFCLLLLDLDDFKALNDTYGHPIGDRMLMAFSQKCRSSIRADDFFARYGGEEFAIVLNNSNLRDGLTKASQICKTVAAARYAMDESQSDDFLSITVSIGVTPFNRNDTVETLIARADKALYDAKRKGKNMAIGRKS